MNMDFSEIRIIDLEEVVTKDNLSKMNTKDLFSMMSDQRMSKSKQRMIVNFILTQPIPDTSTIEYLAYKLAGRCFFSTVLLTAMSSKKDDKDLSNFIKENIDLFFESKDSKDKKTFLQKVDRLFRKLEVTFRQNSKSFLFEGEKKKPAPLLSIGTPRSPHKQTFFYRRALAS